MLLKFSSLFWKLALPVMALSFLTIGLLYFYIPAQIQDRIVEGSIQNSEGTALQYKTLRKYYVSNIVSKVKAGSSMVPAIEHESDPNAIPLPATMIHDLSNILKENGISVDLYSAYPFPNRADRKLDNFQQGAWDYLSKNPKATYVKNVVRNGKEVVRVAVADTMVAPGCVNCHNSHPDTPRKGWKLGDVRGILEIDNDITEQIIAGKETGLNITLMLAASLVLMIFTIYIVYKSVIGKSINVLHRNIDSLTTGESDLTRRLAVQGNDEFSHLARGFNLFLDSYHSLIREIYDSSVKVSQSVEDLDKITTIAKTDTYQQRAQISSIVTGVDQLNASIKNVSENSIQGDHCVNQANERTLTAQKVVENNASTITKVSEELKQAVIILHTLKSDSKSIGSILEVIRGISDQTNLLALNAAIEAARAGEHGRGFSVVADEVRNLASSTNDSTTEINNTIEKLQSGVDSALCMIEASNVNIDVSVEQTSQAVTSFKSITSDITKILELNSQTASIINEQLWASEDILENVTTADNLAGRSNEAADKIKMANETLNDMAGNLHSRVKKFKLD